MDDPILSYKVVSRVLSSWELAIQKHGSREQMGMEILFHMFRHDPQTKVVFGFQPHQKIEENTMLRMGVVVHGVRIFSMLDQVLSLMGPDMETLVEFLETLGERHTNLGVKKEYFLMLSDAVRESLAEMLGDAFSPQDDTAWKDLLSMMTVNITKNMK
jgi:hemoglobin-like flavoprotein